MSDNSGNVARPPAKKRKVPKRRSWVWHYFQFVPGTNVFNCSLCATAVETSGSSTQALIRHLGGEHDVYEGPPSSMCINGASFDVSGDEYSDDDEVENESADGNVNKKIF
jgi:hypothetical protein